MYTTELLQWSDYYQFLDVGSKLKGKQRLLDEKVKITFIDDVGLEGGRNFYMIILGATSYRIAIQPTRPTTNIKVFF